jgi:hypothetical protein
MVELSTDATAGAPDRVIRWSFAAPLQGKKLLFTPLYFRSSTR